MRLPPGFFSVRELLLPPNAIAATRLLLAVLFPVVAGSTRAALAVVLCAGGTDVLDGWLARRGKWVTSTGIVLDPIADKAFALSVVVTLIARRNLPLWAAPCLLLREALEAPLVASMALLTSGRGAGEVGEASANTAGKVATVAEFASVVVALTAPWALTPALVVAASAGFVAGAGYWARELTRRSILRRHDARVAGGTAM
jgi:CDP-diacylglycerol--glycerol-3-phosphate 3-phosphatidyltransferase/cardiolipin synthase